MKDKFPEYYRPSGEELRCLFNSCIFVFDTNALLDIFRLGESYATKVLELIRKYHDRIVIPYHVAKEYHKNYLETICRELASGNNALKSLDIDAYKLIGNEFIEKLPRSIQKDFAKDINNVLVRFQKNVQAQNEYLKKQKDSGELFSEISELLSSTLHTGFSEEEIGKIVQEGKERYENNIPPGYMDKNKVDNIYGDLIIWKEILAISKEKEQFVIFISRDLKKDWITEYSGIRCGPRIELLHEFHETSPGKIFYIYTLDRFINYANDEQKSLQKKDLDNISSILSVHVNAVEESPKNADSPVGMVGVKKLGGKTDYKTHEAIIDTLDQDSMKANKATDEIKNCL